MADTLTIPPAPRYTDYTCPHCKAGAGKPCRFSRSRRPHLLPVHAGRYNKWRRGYERWTAAVTVQHAAGTAPASGHLQCWKA
ncbi:zinc finger domain-containing protein [Actinoplanes utahensis]|uniref:DNA-binding phage zinc finger domain-containing protein n=1 Tax=Actinoplanes utahensis TaxID=1869 RepID=A0A0A6UK51_ACTUT|nr:hypothetical protein [Actinoplanes utahensis]KHD75786.1 hypothetical protein MB27_20260 [Actinoplanes utahensis]GIF32172.1 hypothetical protein Aut01nite_51580 [Actinoplanes utahensis]